jgi:hypothetical protein
MANTNPLQVILPELPLIQALLQSLGLFKGLPADAATQAATLIADIEAIIADAANPKVSALSDVLKLLGDAKVSGAISGAAVDASIEALTKFHAVYNDYTSGQVALIDANFSVGGVPGDLFAISKTSAVRAQLGLA